MSVSAGLHIDEKELNQDVQRFLARYLPTFALWRVEKLFKLINSPEDWWRRKRIGQMLARNSSVKIDPSKGYLMLQPDELLAADAVLEYCRNIYERRETVDWNKSLGKVGIINKLLTEIEIDMQPEILKFALSRDILSPIADYIGTLPRLRAIDLWWSPTNEDIRQSQLFHTDREDLRSVKLFMNIGTVDSGSGPFTFFPADETQRIIEKLGSKYRHKFVGLMGKVSDEEIFSVADPDALIEVTGPPGTICFVDTCRCMHFGSRARNSDRLVYVAMYNGILKRSGPNQPQISNAGKYGKTEIDRLVLGLK